ncbi:MAG: hypothetical protein WCF06_00060 [Nitrososphaeraceae archaeon]
MNKTIALITASILAAGVLGIVSNTGSVYAASAGATASVNAGLATHAEANPGQSSTSGFTGINPPANPTTINQGLSSVASDQGTASSASSPPNLGTAFCGSPVQATGNTCGQAHP